MRLFRRKPIIALHVITMYRDDMLADLLNACQPYLDVMRVADGSGEASTKHVCQMYGAEYYYREWDDNYHEQDNLLLSKARRGDWILIMDDDEIPSKELLTRIRDLVGFARSNGYNMISLPCILSLDGVMEIDVQTFVQETQRGLREPFRKYWLFEYDKTVRSYGTPHRCVETERGWTIYNQPFPYIHYKTKREFIENDCIHSFINQRDQGYTRKEATELVAALSETGWKTCRDVLPGMESGDIPENLKKFMWKYKDEVKRPISRWFWLYYFVYHPDELPEDFDLEDDVSYLAYSEYEHKREGAR